MDTVVGNTEPYITGTNDWSEDYYYQSKKLRRVTTPDGNLDFYNRTGYTTYYAAKDHVGCTWQYETGSKRSFEYPSYYPPGIIDLKPFTSYPYALGGKEFMATNYLDEYFFGARTMYAIMNRFNQVDPLCEEYYSVSPYAYALNNPVRYKDPTGKYVESVWDIFSLVTGAKSFIDNIRAGNVGAAVVDGLGVIVDAAAVVLPGIPGGVGVAAKGVRALDKAVDAAKTVDKTVDSGKAVEKTVGSSRAARREVMRKEGIPTSQQPVSRSKKASGQEYSYDVFKKDGGGATERKSVQQQTLDRSHKESPHWEAGKTKMDTEGKAELNPYGFPRLRNGKSKVYYE